MSTRVALTPLSELPPGERAAIRLIRNEPQVRQGMYTDHEIGEGEHEAWLERVLADPHAAYFAIHADGALAGLVNLTNIHPVHRRADWGFYLSQRFAGQGIGRAFADQLFQHAFDTLGLDKINGEVLETNTGSLAFHRALGFAEEGFRHAHIRREGRSLGIHLFGLTKTGWESREQRA